MPNRIILFGAALFLVIVLGIIASPRGSSSSARINSDQDFKIVIPSKEPIPEPATELTVALSNEQQQQALADVLAKEHLTISGKMGAGKQYFALDFLGHNVTNPSILPHPHPMKGYAFVMFGQHFDNTTKVHTHLGCAATMNNGTLQCMDPPVALPVAGSVSDKCSSKNVAQNYIPGPRNLRIAYGPDRPYAIWGAPSEHTCMGMHMQDLKRLYEWDYTDNLKYDQPFFLPTDLQRPGAYAQIEKDWFVFWDRAGELHVHFNAAPQRHYAKVNATGGIGPDLAPAAAASDEACIAQLMPKITHTGWEQIQQASNSLMVTLCDREDPTCFETEHNTFIMSIINHKSAFSQEVHDPYVMLFRRTPPFELHAISKVPLWINGRTKPSATNLAPFSISSMHWKARGNNYQGYLNHELLIGFTTDDNNAGAIDVLAGDFLDISNFAVCGS